MPWDIFTSYLCDKGLSIYLSFLPRSSYNYEIIVSELYFYLEDIVRSWYNYKILVHTFYILLGLWSIKVITILIILFTIITLFIFLRR